MISPSDFVQYMRNHWETRLGNVSSGKLDAIWSQIAEAFNDAIRDADAIHGDDRKWRILQPPTGTGKTQGLAVFCAMLAASAPDTGVLIAVRIKDQADQLASLINELSAPGGNARVAVAKHTGSPTTNEEASQVQILVITHKAFTMALEQADVCTDRWSNLANWKHGARKLTVVDEALDVAEHIKLVAGELQQVLGVIPRSILKSHEEELAFLKKVKDAVERASDTSPKAKILWRCADEFGSRPSLASLREALKKVRWDTEVLRRLDESAHREWKAKVDQVLTSAESVAGHWAYFSRIGKEETANTARLIVPRGVTAPVVMDATASQNLVWELFEDAREPYAVPSHARNYQNVTLHVARASGLGKTILQGLGADVWYRVASAIAEKMEPGRRLLVCSHKATGAARKSRHFGEGVQVSHTHYGEIDGRNDWAGFDAALLIGLPYRGNVWASSTFCALQRLPEGEWFGSTQEQSWGTYDNIQSELETRQLVVSLVQAMNRIRCRRVIDADGNCDPCDIYICLPKGRRGEEILAHLTEAMNGIRVVDWVFELDNSRIRKVRKSSVVEGVLEYLRGAAVGSYKLSKIRSDLSLSKGSFGRIKGRFTKPSPEMRAVLLEAGIEVCVEVTRSGREQVTFVKRPDSEQLQAA